MNSSIEDVTDTSTTYERIAKAITFMRQHHLSQPDLKTLAQHVHLSEYHFQRLFTAWAGISPKRFAQYLTVEYAKAKITETKSLLDLTIETGLSSPGRLHDLFVKLEAMSPGEFKAGGAGLQIRYGIHTTPFGPCLIATTTRGICNLQFLDNADETIAAHYLRIVWPDADIVCDQQVTEAIHDRIFTPAVDHAPLILHIKGTNFQIQVWRALLQIPFAGITTYQGLATSVGRPTAARAIGNAIGSNPIAYLIPCHRVIRESGELGGYRWGLDRKVMLLGWEASRAT
ncbi:MAG TPA: methylated-DNA--[protein]-cysteine S-methyltransferase [Microcoleaceae cyanobacterium]|jgi:AraC family transcriptional regulator of adaptative response/methylated-DNA-[protein]-cysteine methyltransferase